MMLDIKGFEKLYAITDDGQLWSYSKLAGRSKRLGRYIKPQVNKYGYLHVHLYNNGSTNKTIHRLVAEAYIENPEGYKQVNHINGNKLDNRIKNLEWCDAYHNMQHAYKNGLNSQEHRKKHDNS